MSTVSCALPSYPITEMTTDSAEFNDTHSVLPSTVAEAFDAAWQLIVKTAAIQNLHTAADLIDHHKPVLRHIAGVTNLTARLALDERDRIHLHRNVLLTVLLGAAHVARIDTTSLAEAISTLTRRTQRTDRPLFDDEIALLRTRAVIALGRKATAQAATVYTLCDAGQECRETTHVTPSDLDDTTAPTMVNALGYRGLDMRILLLEAFHTNALATRLAMLPQGAPDQTIAYNPRTSSPGSDTAMVSAYGVIERLLDAAGLRHPDVSPSSIRRWRIAHTLSTKGLIAAADIAGRPVEQVERLAGVTLPRTAPTTTGITRF